MSHNEITGDEIKSKVNTAEYEANYDKIFRRKPESLDAAYERRAMMQGLVVNPLFEENKELVEQTIESRVEAWHSGKGNDKSLREYLGMSTEEYQEYVTGVIWPTTEERIDIIAQNGNTGEHYEEESLCHICGKDLNKTEECAFNACPLNFR